MPLHVVLVNSLDPAAALPYARSLLAGRAERSMLTYDLAAASAGLIARRTDTGAADRSTAVVVDAGDCVTCTVAGDVAAVVTDLAAATDSRTEGVVVLLPPGVESQVVRERLARRPPVDLCGVVSLVDCARLLDRLRSADRLAATAWSDGPCDSRTLGELVARQVEDSDVVVAYGDDADRALLGALNPAARIDRLPDPRTSVRRSATAARPGAQPWTVTWFRRAPIDPDRLERCCTSLLDMSVRGRGTAWLADRPEASHQWDSTGSRVTLQVGPDWAVGGAQWDRPSVPVPRTASAKPEEPHQAIRLVGLDVPPEAAVALLDGCLTDGDG